MVYIQKSITPVYLYNELYIKISTWYINTNIFERNWLPHSVRFPCASACVRACVRACVCSCVRTYQTIILCEYQQQVYNVSSFCTL